MPPTTGFVLLGGFGSNTAVEREKVRPIGARMLYSQHMQSSEAADLSGSGRSIEAPMDVPDPLRCLLHTRYRIIRQGNIYQLQAAFQRACLFWCLQARLLHPYICKSNIS